MEEVQKVHGASAPDAEHVADEHKLRVIVIDDDEMVRHVVTRVVRRRNCDVLPFDNADACCVYAKTGQACPHARGDTCADALLTDVSMPDGNGLDFLDALARCKCQIPHKGVMSGFWSAPSLERARMHGCRIFVKPVGVLEIEHWLTEIKRADSDASLPSSA